MNNLIDIPIREFTSIYFADRHEFCSLHSWRRARLTNVSITGIQSHAVSWVCWERAQICSPSERCEIPQMRENHSSPIRFLDLGILFCESENELQQYGINTAGNCIGVD